MHEEGFKSPEKRESKLELSAYGESVAEEGEENADALLNLPEKGLFAVFDGVARDRGGERASKMVRDRLQERATDLRHLQTPEEIKDFLGVVLEEISHSLAETSKKEELPKNMGTTAAVLKILDRIDGAWAIIAHVGNSRVYRYRDVEGGVLEALTIDDGVQREVGEDPQLQMQAQKVMSEVRTKEDFVKKREDIREGIHVLSRIFFENRARLTQYIGQKRPLRVSFSAIPLSRGDRFLLVTDGVHDNLTDSEMKELMKAHEDTQEATVAFMQAANERAKDEKSVRAKEDDMTTLVVSFGATV